MEQIPPVRRTIRLFPDYGRDYPLWENTTSTWDVGYTTTPEDYGLSPRLAARLADWQAFWASHFDPTNGWDATDKKKQWEQDGRRLAVDLQREVGPFADVQVEF